MARGCPLSEIHIEDKGVTAYKYTQYGFLGVLEKPMNYLINWIIEKCQ
jgi:hypothetical protein